MRDNSEYRGEYRAGQARMYADWLVGLSMTRYVTVSLRDAGYKAGVMSVGRVQTPTLGLVVERDRAIREFSPSPYYSLSAVLSLDESRTLRGGWTPKDTDLGGLDVGNRITGREFADLLVKKLDGANGLVISVTKAGRRISPPLPYSLPKLQIAASQKYDITDTLAHVQKLYESGYVTYPRSGCEYIPEGHFAEAGKIIEAVGVACPSLSDMLGGADFSRKSPAWNDAKILEHHAIIPTSRVPFENALSETERKIYGLICSRYALQFLEDYEYEETAVEFGAEGETFRATGRTTVRLGWRGWEKGEDADAADKKNKEDEDEREDGGQILPAVRQGESGILHASLGEHETKPPKPYTYHALLSAMIGIHVHVKDPDIRAKLKESRGIGTEATQEGIISTLFARGYVEKKKKIIQSTELGRMLIDVLNGGKSAVMTRPDMTALWEGTMSDIEAGKVSLESFVDEVAGMAREMTSETLLLPPDVPGLERGSTKNEEIVESPCPLGCGKQARRYEGKFGYFWKCSCSPDVVFRDVDSIPVVKETQAEATCPAKGCKGKALRFASKKDGRPFWKCRKCGGFFDDGDGRPKAREGKK
jgi:DNA topoisomerase-3